LTGLPEENIMNENAIVNQNEAVRTNPSRRGFCASALAALGVSLADVISPEQLEAAPQDTSVCTPTPQFQPFVPVAEFVRHPAANPSDANLDVNMTVKAAWRNVTTISGQGPQCKRMKLRYYEGRYANNSALKWAPNPALSKWPASPDLPGPGPTFRLRVGDRVRIHLSNEIDPSDFPNTTPDEMACDSQTVIDPTTGQPVPLYPHGETMPSCFHGDNTTNLHFHGTHVTPNGHGDNVMIDVYPKGHVPPPPPDEPPNFSEYTNDFRIPLPPPASNPVYPAKKMQMGQAPGTHWYHAHKHGSVALQLLNGMSGAFIIEGEFDDELEKLMPGLRRTEKVLVIQQIGDQITIQPQANSIQPGDPLNTCAGGDPRTLVNGQLQPAITMQPGEIQRWRIINATMQQVSYLSYSFIGKNGSGYVPTIRQIAYDGIQIAPERYNDPDFGLAQQFTLAPANRIDILVQAPATEGESLLGFKPVHNLPQAGCKSTTTIDPYLLQLSVKGNPISPAMSFPTVQNFPHLPAWLEWNENDPIKEARTLQFNWYEYPKGNTRPHNGQPAIDGKIFDGTLHTAQVVDLDTREEWKLENYWNSSIHPFHIHVNPFQILEIFDPNNPPETQLTKMKPPYVWRDTIAIPASTGTIAEPNVGYVRIRSRFVDFPGTFVLHCHILDHEDRGMMQMVEIVDPKSRVIPRLPQHH
jgi:FtsP/CotA-like multicopper oxidase with cupredoxin domain